MKKVLFIIWSHSFGGGAEALLTTIVNQLNPQKYEIGIIEIYRANIKKEPVNSNIKVYDSITWKGDPEYRKKIYYIYNAPDEMIRRYIPSDYDLYVSFNYQLPSFLLPNGTRNIAWIHGAIFDLSENGMEQYRFLQSRAFEKVKKIISISDVTTKSIQELFPHYADKIVEVYNSININTVREKAQDPAATILNHPAVIYVGRFDENKNPIRMVDIFNSVAREVENIHLYFLGKGELESEVRKKVSEYGLQEQVHFLGYMENPFPVIKQADVCCMTSKSEGFPMSLLESVALHVPFVSTEVGGARILTNEGRCGRVCRTNEEAVVGITEILGTSKELLAKECEKSISRFDLEVYISRIERLFDEVLNSEFDLVGKQTWDIVQSTGDLEDRDYYYCFPKELIENGKKIILYGAGDIGRNYYHYIMEKGYWSLVAWVDAAAEKYRKMGSNVQDIEDITYMEYDVILIAVMEDKVAQSIRRNLCECGISNDRICWTVPTFYTWEKE
ncbi:MAG: glycosyltransferase [Lachnospiraceae bacterium]|nr:glycosyltransferase [Lachnospiraceae bacterium]